ncbi:MAG: hypothetical protein IKW30_11735 [Lachnospiraceae bacterium]|nr:hypothetical protein [Lachnospiraceae bacterium]
MKKNNTNTTKAFDYCMYKMFANNFYSTRCKNQLYVKRMQMDFMELNPDKKTEYEVRCYSLIKQMKKMVPETFFRNNVEIHVLPKEEGNVEFVVASKGQELHFYTNNQKKKAYLHCRLTKCA